MLHEDGKEEREGVCVGGGGGGRDGGEGITLAYTNLHPHPHVPSRTTSNNEAGTKAHTGDDQRLRTVRRENVEAGWLY